MANFLSKTIGALFVLITLSALGLIFFKFALSSFTDIFKNACDPINIPIAYDKYPWNNRPTLKDLFPIKMELK